MIEDPKEREHRLVVVAPSYNNATTLRDLLDGVLDHCSHVIVINDGSTDDTASILETWAADHTDAAIDIITHSTNQSKAIALKNGFSRARALGYTHALTIDTDGQHSPSDIPSLEQASQEGPASLILGNRDSSAPDYPKKSQFGRWLSDLSVRLQTGLRVGDTQCGLRVYPLAVFDVVHCVMSRYAYEPELVTRSVWAGCGVVNVPVHCKYFEGDARVSHFHPTKDGILGAVIHIRLLLRSLLPLRVAQMAGTEHHAQTTGTWWDRLMQWISPHQLWELMQRDNVSRSTLATGTGLGAFIATLPCYGFQTVLALFVARRLHIHPIAVVLGSQWSIPPISPFLIGASIWTGFFVLHGRSPSMADFDVEHMETAALIGRVLAEWTIGSLIVGTLLGLFTTAATLGLLSLVPQRAAGSKSEADT